MLRPLCFVANPFFEESPSSVLMRIALHNGYSSILSMSEDLQITERTMGEWILNDGMMCAMFCKAAPKLQEALKECFYFQSQKPLGRSDDVIVQGMRVPWMMLRRPQVFCPMCLEEGYTRYIQDIADFKYCPYHAAEYLRSCTACQRPYKWRNSIDSLCRCGHDFRKSPVTLGDNSSAIQLLQLFRTQNQETFNRTIAALKCLKPRNLETMRNSDFMAPALQIGFKNEETLKYILTGDLETYKQLHPIAIFYPWLTSENEWIQVTSSELYSQLRWEKRLCTTDCCCKQLGLTSSFFHKNLSMSDTVLSEAVTGGKLKKTHSGVLNYYSSPNMCDFVDGQLEKIKIKAKNKNSYRARFHYLSDVVNILHIPNNPLKALIKIGLLGQTKKLNKRVTLISKKQTKTFNSTYISSATLAMELSLVARQFTMKKIIESLNIQSIDISTLTRNKTNIYPRALLTPEIKNQIIILTNSITRQKTKKTIKLSAQNIAKQLKVKISSASCMIKNPQHFVKNIAHILPLPDDDQPTALLKEFKKWRDSHYTIPEITQQLNITNREFNARFFRKTPACLENVLQETFYDKATLKKICINAERYVNKRNAGSLGNFSESQITRLVKAGFIRKLRCTNHALSSCILLYYTSDILACKHGLRDARNILL